MILSRAKFFLIVFLIVVAPFAVYKIIWIAHSAKTTGIMGFVGHGYAGDQLQDKYSVIFFNVGKDEFWFNSNGNVIFKKGEVIPVRYKKNNPYDARVNTFIFVWGDTFIYAGVPVAMLIAVFFHPLVIPRRSKVMLKSRKPFIRLIAA